MGSKPIRGAKLNEEIAQSGRARKNQYPDQDVYSNQTFALEARGRRFESGSLHQTTEDKPVRCLGRIANPVAPEMCVRFNYDVFLQQYAIQPWGGKVSKTEAARIDTVIACQIHE